MVSQNQRLSVYAQTNNHPTACWAGANGICVICFQGVRRKVSLQKQPLTIQGDVHCKQRAIEKVLEVLVWFWLVECMQWSASTEEEAVLRHGQM